MCVCVCGVCVCVCVFRFAVKFNLVDKAIAAALYLLITADGGFRRHCLGVKSMGVMCYLTNRCMLGRIFHTEVNTHKDQLSVQACIRMCSRLILNCLGNHRSHSRKPAAD